ncbi:MAG: Uma2 family endonuclease, partial [Pseudomonadota bacterium]
KVPDPFFVAEVTSPSTYRNIDPVLKVGAYESLPTIQHYLIINPLGLPLIHRQRDANGAFQVQLVDEPLLTLDPPGLELDLRTIFD